MHSHTLLKKSRNLITFKQDTEMKNHIICQQHTDWAKLDCLMGKKKLRYFFSNNKTLTRIFCTRPLSLMHKYKYRY